MSTYLGARPLPTQGSRLFAAVKRLPVVQSVYSRVIDNAKASEGRVIKKHPELWKKLDEDKIYWFKHAFNMPEIRYLVEDHFEKFAKMPIDDVLAIVSGLEYTKPKGRHFFAKNFLKLENDHPDKVKDVVSLLQLSKTEFIPWIEKNMDRILSLPSSNISDLSLILGGPKAHGIGSSYDFDMKNAYQALEECFDIKKRVIDDLPLTEIRKAQMFRAMLKMITTNHTKETLSPSDADEAKWYEDRNDPNDFSVSFNYNMGASDGPVMYALPDMMHFMDDENVIYRSTLTKSDGGAVYVLPDKLQNKIDAQTPEEVKQREGSWVKGGTLHESFVRNVAQNIKALGDDILFKKGKEDKVSLDDLKNMKILSSLDQADTHNVALRILCPENISADGSFTINVELIDLVTKEMADKGRPYQGFDYEKYAFDY